MKNVVGLFAASLAVCLVGCPSSSSGTPCATDVDCPSGNYCAMGSCTSDCRMDADCAGAGAHCDAHGRCGGVRDGGASDGGGVDAARPDGGSDTGHAVDTDGDGDPSSTDCDDNDPARFHGNIAETNRCDNVDNDCNPATLGPDNDGDHFSAIGCCNPQPDGTLLCGTDCNDNQPTVNPSANEIPCNSLDDNCDGRVDEVTSGTCYVDADHDGYAHDATGSMIGLCTCPPGFTMTAPVTDATDCNDASPAQHPGAVEVCDLADNDCNGLVDDGSGVGLACYPDADRDGFAPAGIAPMNICTGACPPSMTSRAPTDATNTDCNDLAADQLPQSMDACNGVDNNCSSGGGPDPAEDADGDHHSSPTAPCTTVTSSDFPLDDCDDHNATVYASRLAYADADSDGHCASGAMMMFCTSGGLPAGYVASCPAGMTDDCDTSPLAYVNRTVYRDADADGHCSSGPSTQCTNGSAPAGYAFSCPGGASDDCDSNSAGYVNGMYAPDQDHDGYCASSFATYCTNGTAPAGFTSSCPHGNSDCNDYSMPASTFVSCTQDGDGDGYCVGSPANYCGACPAGRRQACQPMPDCADINPYVTTDCGDRPSMEVGDLGHCCCIGCGQPDPWNNDVTGNCDAGYYPIDCDYRRITGSGNGTVASYGLVSTSGTQWTCRMHQACGPAFCDGSRITAHAICRPLGR